MSFVLAAFADEASPSLSGQIKAMKENGISCLEIRGVDGENIADISAAKAKEIRKALEAEGLYVWSLGSPYGKIGLDEDFTPHLEKFKKSLETAEILGADHLRLFSFYNASGRFSEVCERLGKFIRAAEGSGILLCHENEKDIYGDISKRCVEIHETFPELRAIFDPANFVQTGQDTLEAWEQLKTYVEYMHIKDAEASGFVVPAGKGIGNLKKILSEYKGRVLTVEPHLTVFQGLKNLEADKKSGIGSYTYPDSFTAFKAAVDALKEII